MGLIFCIPYAGSSAAIYSRWKQYMEKGWDLQPIELSGRGSRFGEELYLNIKDTVNDIYSKISSSLDQDYIIYGHSMGGIIAYELTQKIHRNNALPPKHVIFSGCVPPNKFRLSGIDVNSDSQLKQKILSLGGTSSHIFDDPNLADVFLPILRADYLMLQEYRFNTKDPPLTEDISIFYGKKDNSISISDIMTWENMTEGKTHYYEFEGDHFFLNYETYKVIDCICKICRNIYASI